jgi:hypothetical protein
MRGPMYTVLEARTVLLYIIMSSSSRIISFYNYIADFGNLQMHIARISIHQLNKRKTTLLLLPSILFILWKLFHLVQSSFIVLQYFGLLDPVSSQNCIFRVVGMLQGRSTYGEMHFQALPPVQSCPITTSCGKSKTISFNVVNRVEASCIK